MLLPPRRIYVFSFRWRLEEKFEVFSNLQHEQAMKKENKDPSFRPLMTILSRFGLKPQPRLGRFLSWKRLAH